MVVLDTGWHGAASLHPGVPGASEQLAADEPVMAGDWICDLGECSCHDPATDVLFD